MPEIKPQAAIQQLQDDQAKIARTLDAHAKRLDELDKVKVWHDELRATTKATKLAFAALGALLGLVISILVIIDKWPKS